VTFEPMVLLTSMLIGLAIVLFLNFILPIIDTVAGKYISDLKPKLEQLYLPTEWLVPFLRIWTFALVGVPLAIALVLDQYFIAALFLYMIFISPREICNSTLRKTRMKLRDQLVPASTNFANAVRAVLSPAKALDSILPETPEPLARFFRRIMSDYQGGRPFAEALREVQQRVDLEAFTLFSSAILVCLERGGNLAEVLDRISKSLQENQRLERKRDADTASGAKTVRILAIMPFAFLFMFYAADPVGTGLIFTTTLGQVIFIIVLVLDYIAVRIARRILRLDEPIR
jgi:tight adherence protein B